MKLKILFLGTPSFVLPVLEMLHQQHEVIGVVTTPDRLVGRKQTITPSPVKARALALNIPVVQPEKASEIPSLITKPFDFLITASYGQYLPETVLKMAKKDSLNVHPSLLPKYRGATPVPAALLYGDKETGVSIIRMTKDMDAGPIFAQEKFTVATTAKTPELLEKAFLIGASLLSKVLDKYAEIKPVKQDEKGATHCGKILKEDGKVELGRDTPEEIYNKFRAYSPWPGVYILWKDKKVDLTDIELADGKLKIKKVKLEGKKEMNLKDFLNGYPEFPFPFRASLHGASRNPLRLY